MGQSWEKSPRWSDSSEHSFDFLALLVQLLENIFFSHFMGQILENMGHLGSRYKLQVLYSWQFFVPFLG